VKSDKDVAKARRRGAVAAEVEERSGGVEERNSGANMKESEEAADEADGATSLRSE